MKTSRYPLPLLAAVFALQGVACGDATPEETLTSASDELTDVKQSRVKRQSIGNCWIYATASWAESLNKSARKSGEMNMSESYWTYWHWFDQISAGWLSSGELSTGGDFETSSDIIRRYGVVTEGDFVYGEASIEMSARQKEALAVVNESLKTGALKDLTARRDRALVRRELDRAWRLTPSVKKRLDTAFGPDVSRTIGSGATLAGTRIASPDTIPAKLIDPATKEPVTKTLADAIGSGSSAFRWREAYYPRDAAGRRDLLKRVQRAMHDRQPVIMSWFVDFNSLDNQGRFAAPPTTPGHQGGHMVVVEDYQINDVPGFGTLPAGVLETRPAALEAALSSEASIEFIRVKNSWGSFRPDRQFVLPGYHDLYLKYLNGPVKKCAERPDGTPDTTRCSDHVPLWDVVLPAGY
ncbi:MAG: hypothetical protein IPG50_39785 [Myxococcales bacterium]|nr:hypothetical protein [Myxococcales bacterium]